MRSVLAKYGWKTILGTLLLAAGEVMDTDIRTAPYSPLVKAAGTVLGGIGLRVAVAKEKTCA